MKKTGLTIFSGLMAMTLLFGQKKSFTDEVLFTVEDDTITAGEYMAVYNKNRDVGENIDPKTPKEYLDLYINFKLKVHQAREMGKDTLPAFQREYEKYKKQLAQPYLTDKNVIKEMVREAYERKKQDVRASHIMVKVPANAPPEDTLKAYKKIQTIRQKLKEGESFSNLAKEYSDDSYSAKKGGDLGYFTVFDMVYPFEDAAYTTDEGEVTEPFRSKFGYHILKTTDKRPARGTITVAHLMISNDAKSSKESSKNAKKRIKEIHKKLEDGADFAKMVRQYSEDKSSKNSKGVLRPFGINKMYQSFEDAAFALKKPGDMTEPVKTPVGWHIIKLIDKKELPEFEEIKENLKKQVKRDSRSKQGKQSVIKRLKKDYNYKEYPARLEVAFEQVDGTLLKGNYKAEDIEDEDKVLIEFVDKSYTVGDYLRYLEKNQRKYTRSQSSLQSTLYEAFDSFGDKKLIAYEKSRLGEKYPQYRLLSREYFEGILLFDLTEEKVWQKAMKDSAGLEEFYEDRKKDYKWKERYKGVMIDAATKKLAKKARKMLKNEETLEAIKQELNEESSLNVAIDTGTFEKNSTKYLKNVTVEQEGLTERQKINDRYMFMQVNAILPPSAKTLEEARGKVISDYQKELEKRWLKNLKDKYEVKVNEDVLKKVVKKLEAKA